MSATKRMSTGIAAGALLISLLPATPANASCYSANHKEHAFARKINLARAATGENRLRLDPQLSKAAKVHTHEMVRKDLLYHTPTDALKHRVTNWMTLGENVGVGGTVSSLHTAFMNSAPHRANILYPTFRYVGVGTLEAGGRLWVTVIFESHADPGSPLC
ncbi:MAG TPA: CAP domain-containing protein [Actinomycetota bacterium]|nr:CAP domain-containing protein [Actinomycetota bacterium]